MKQTHTQGRGENNKCLEFEHLKTDFRKCPYFFRFKKPKVYTFIPLWNTLVQKIKNKIREKKREFHLRIVLLYETG